MREEKIPSLSQRGKHIQAKSPRGPTRTPRFPSASSAYSRRTCGSGASSERGLIRRALTSALIAIALVSSGRFEQTRGREGATGERAQQVRAVGCDPELVAV